MSSCLDSLSTPPPGSLVSRNMEEPSHSSDSLEKAASNKPSSSAAEAPQGSMKAESFPLERLNFEETQNLANSIIAILQINGALGLDSIAAKASVHKVHAARVLDILTTTPIVSVVREEDSENGTRHLYQYCQGKKLPIPVPLNSLRTEISEEMKAISDTYESVSQLRDILSRPSKGVKDDMALKSFLEKILDKEKINSADGVNKTQT